jgi:dihydroorotase
MRLTIQHPDFGKAPAETEKNVERAVSFKTARTMLANGFMPDCISSDVHALCIEGPAFDLLTTLSKFICLGMPLGDVIRTATENPARALKRGDLGTFRKGAAGDASILTLETGRFDYVDSTGEHLDGEKRLTANGVIIGGAVFAA